MDGFDDFCESLFDESKFMFEKALETSYSNLSQLYLHASLLTAMSSLEAYINAVCDELTSVDTYKIDLYGKMILAEKEIDFNNGDPILGSRLKMSRLKDRILYIYYRFSHKHIQPTDQWYSDLCNTIELRNALVHPKERLVLTPAQVESALRSVLWTVNEIYNAVYNRPVPILSYDLMSVRKYDE